MKIVIIHNLYLQPGGEDVVVENERTLLSANGYEVKLIIKDNAAIRDLGAVGKVANLLRGIWSPGSVRAVLAEIEAFAPDVVHIHNLWYQMNPALISALKRRGIPVVMTLHNFRLLCANALLYRKGGNCHRCLDRGNPLWGVWFACYRGSRIQSSLPVLMSFAGRLAGVWRRGVDAYICLTPFSRRIFVQAGFPEERLHVKPNFLPGPYADAGGTAKHPGPRAIFVGRLSEEKGINTVLEAWQGRSEELILAGSGETGPLPPRVSRLGHVPRKEVLRTIGESWILIAPSLWHETFGLTLIEAFMMGTPVVASSNGTFDTLIEHGRTGLLFRPGDAAGLSASLDLLFRDPELRSAIAARARADFLRKFAEEPNLRSLDGIYRSAIAVSRAAQ